jgi:hypothetical protein
MVDIRRTAAMAIAICARHYKYIYCVYCVSQKPNFFSATGIACQVLLFCCCIVYSGTISEETKKLVYVHAHNISFGVCRKQRNKNSSEIYPFLYSWHITTVAAEPCVAMNSCSVSCFRNSKVFSHVFQPSYRAMPWEIVLLVMHIMCTRKLKFVAFSEDGLLPGWNNS